MSTQYRYIGKRLKRRDGEDMVTGSARFLDDLEFRNLLHGKVLRSPHAHARIKAIDKSRAAALPGVRAVLTWEDIPDWRGGTPRNVRILDNKVRYVGDAVALVAATSESAAEEALSLIEVDYEVLPAVFSIDAALQPDAPLLYEELKCNILPGGTPIYGPKCLQGLEHGDINRGFAEADVICEGTAGFENIPNALPPEPPGAIAIWEPPDKATLYGTSQAPYMDKISLYHVFNREIQVRCIGNHVGASFGTKIMCWQVQAYAILLARATRCPVKVMFTKEEQMTSFTLRVGSRVQAKIGLKKDGTITAIQGMWFVDSGYYSFTTQCQVAVGLGELQLFSQCPNWDLKSSVVVTNRNASGATRGFGGQELNSSLIPVLSLGMEMAGLDPLEVIKKNFVKPGGAYFWRNGEWYDYRGIDFTAAIERGAERFGWNEKWKGWWKPSAVEGRLRRGVGVGIHGNADIGEDTAEAYVQLDYSGTATIFLCAVEHGTGQKSNYPRLAAEVLGIPPERIAMSPADTLVTPFEFGPVGSRGTYAIGSAVIRAAENAREQILQMASARLGVPAGDLDTADGVVFVKQNPSKKVRWSVIGNDRTIMGYGRFEQDFTMCNCLLSFVEAEVDIETGLSRLVRVVNATDIGQIIDPPGLENQLNACWGSAGIDGALMEETILDPGSGSILNANLADYCWRPFSEIPEVENVILETPFPSNRFKAVGIAEITNAPGPAALLMAVSNAIGVRLTEYPTTPDRILKSLGKTT